MRTPTKTQRLVWLAVVVFAATALGLLVWHPLPDPMWREAGQYLKKRHDMIPEPAESR